MAYIGEWAGNCEEICEEICERITNGQMKPLIIVIRIPNAKLPAAAG